MQWNDMQCNIIAKRSVAIPGSTKEAQSKQTYDMWCPGSRHFASCRHLQSAFRHLAWWLLPHNPIQPTVLLSWWTRTSWRGLLHLLATVAWCVIREQLFWSEMAISGTGLACLAVRCFKKISGQMITSQLTAPRSPSTNWGQVSFEEAAYRKETSASNSLQPSHDMTMQQCFPTYCDTGNSSLVAAACQDCWLHSHKAIQLNARDLSIDEIELLKLFCFAHDRT